MYIASATTRTGYVARGIAGKEAYSVVESYQTAARDIIYGVYFYDHVACGIASGQGGTKNRLTCHAADSVPFTVAEELHPVMERSL